MSGKQQAPLKDRLLAMCDLSGGEDACWLWTGHLVRGYGNISDGRKRKHIYAHRAAYEVFVGPIPEGGYILHSCDNPRCCNPRHLRVGDQLDNMRDMFDRGRSTRGRNARAKLNSTDAASIRARRKAGEKLRTIAADFGVAESVVSRIANGTRWGWL